MKKQLGLIIGVIIILVAGFVFWQNQSSAPTSNVKNQASVAADEKLNTTPGPQAPVDSNTPTTTETKAVVYTTDEVTTHNNPADCWAIVDGGVYNLTTWVSQHPGGEKAIIGLCGIDGTDQFAKIHGSNEKAKAALASFLIGKLSN